MQRTLTVIVAVILLATFSHAQARRGPRFSEWATPVHLPPPINTEFDDHAAVLSKDEKTMFFTSNRPDSVMDSEDIWISKRRNSQADWETPGPVEHGRQHTGDGKGSQYFCRPHDPAKTIFHGVNAATILCELASKIGIESPL